MVHRPQGIASPDEVLETFTAMLRSDKSADQLKAAENLAKHYGILAPREEKSPVKAGLAGEIEAAIRSLEARAEADRPSLEESPHGQARP